MVCGSLCRGAKGRGGPARSEVGRPGEVSSSGLRDLERPRRTLRFCAKLGSRARHGSKPLPVLWFLPFLCKWRPRRAGTGGLHAASRSRPTLRREGSRPYTPRTEGAWGLASGSSPRKVTGW